MDRCSLRIAAVAIPLLFQFSGCNAKDVSASKPGAGAKPAASAPDSMDITLPTGEKVRAIRVPGAGAKLAPPPGMEMIVKGKIIVDSEPPQGRMAEVVLETPTGERFLLSNAAYANTLKFNAMGKNVKLKCRALTPTSYKNYPAIYIQDILEVK